MFVPLSLPSPSPDWKQFDLAGWLHTTFGWNLPFPLHITAYAICILTGIIVAVWWTSARLTKRGGEPGIVLDIALWTVPLGIIGARAYHVLTHPNDYFGAGKNLGEVIAIWDGGNAIFGSIIGGAVGILIACQISGIRFWSFADALAPGMLAAQALGRLGNYFNQELFGQPTDLPWGLQIDRPNPAIPIGLPASTLFHPTFLYEIIWNVFGIVLLLLLERQYQLRWGRMIAFYFIWYGIGRSWFESIRLDPSEVFFGIRSNVWAAFASIIVGLVILIVQRARHRGLEPSVYRPGREWSPAPSGVDSDETYSDSDDSGNVAANTPELAATSGAGSTS